MLNHDERNEVHYLIVLELSIQSLERDAVTLEKLKLRTIYLQFTEPLIKLLRHDYNKLKNKLKMKRIRIVGWRAIEEPFVVYTISTSGENEEIVYARQALQFAVEYEIRQKLGLNPI